jgi:hypothetical protein
MEILAFFMVLVLGIHAFIKFLDMITGINVSGWFYGTLSNEEKEKIIKRRLERRAAARAVERERASEKRIRQERLRNKKREREMIKFKNTIIKHTRKKSKAELRKRLEENRTGKRRENVSKLVDDRKEQRTEQGKRNEESREAFSKSYEKRDYIAEIL